MSLIPVAELRTREEVIAHAREVARRASARYVRKTPRRAIVVPIEETTPVPEPVYVPIVSAVPDDIREASAALPVQDFPTLKFIVRHVAKAYRCDITDLLSERRHKDVMEPRQMVEWIARKVTPWSLPKIARSVAALRGGGCYRDHSTVVHSCRKTEAKRAASAEFTAQSDALKDSVMDAWRARAAETVL